MVFYTFLPKIVFSAKLEKYDELSNLVWFDCRLGAPKEQFQLETKYFRCMFES